jgi:hypothetical protein
MPRQNLRGINRGPAVPITIGSLEDIRETTIRAIVVGKPLTPSTLSTSLRARRADHGEQGNPSRLSSRGNRQLSQSG